LALWLLGTVCLAGVCAWAQEEAGGDEAVVEAEQILDEEAVGEEEAVEEAVEEEVLEEEVLEEEVLEEEILEEEVVEEEVLEEEVLEEAPAAPPLRPAPVRPMPARPTPATPSRSTVRRVIPTRPATPLPRPAGPAGPADDPLVKAGGMPTDPTSFDFNDVPLNQVVESIGRMTGRNFNIDPSISSTHITVITHDEIPPDMAYEVLESILASRNFAMVETLDGHMINIVPMGESLEKVQLHKGMKGVPEAFDTLSTHIVSIQYADAGELAGILQKLGSRVASVDAYQRTNTLIITDTADGLRRIFTFLEEIDVAGYDTEMEIFTLEYAFSDVLASQVQEVLIEAGPAGARPSTTTSRTRTTRPTRLPVRPTVPGQANPMIIGSGEETLRIVPDDRLNALIVVASASMMERVRDLVAKLDTPTPYEDNRINVYPLLNANAEEVEQALSAILGVTPRKGAEKGAPTAEVTAFEKKVVISRYEQGNSLLILASPQDYKLIKEIIAQLDVPQRQVLVEAIVMDVSIQDTFGLSVDAAALTGNDGFALGGTSNISSLFDVTSLAEGLATGTAGATVASSLLNLSSAGGLTTGIYDTFDVTIDGQDIEVPFIPLLLRSLQTLTDIDILSQPSLTTRDNEPADIIVGQEIPVPMQRAGYSYDPRTQEDQTPRYGMTSYGRGISRQDVGVKMTVTPHINEGDYVTLETEIEVSEATPSSVGIDANELGPTLNKSRVMNNVVVKDGTTGVIGGLIRETASHTGSEIPGLSDVPLIGWLFRTRNDTRKKQNVVILITPYIIKDGIDLERVTDYKMDEFRRANVDVLFEKGVIKRVKRRHYMRSKHRPSQNRAEQMLQERRYGRGDIQR